VGIKNIYGLGHVSVTVWEEIGDRHTYIHTDRQASLIGIDLPLEHKKQIEHAKNEIQEAGKKFCKAQVDCMKVGLNMSLSRYKSIRDQGRMARLHHRERMEKINNFLNLLRNV
jgi:hypothetical protein